MRVGPITEYDIVKREIKIFIKGLKENNHEIMLDSPDEYLRNDKLHQNHHVFPTPFTCTMLYV